MRRALVSALLVASLAVTSCTSPAPGSSIAGIRVNASGRDAQREAKAAGLIMVPYGGNSPINNGIIYLDSDQCRHAPEAATMEQREEWCSPIGAFTYDYNDTIKTFHVRASGFGLPATIAARPFAEYLAQKYQMTVTDDVALQRFLMTGKDGSRYVVEKGAEAEAHVADFN